MVGSSVSRGEARSETTKRGQQGLWGGRSDGCSKGGNAEAQGAVALLLLTMTFFETFARQSHRETGQTRQRWEWTMIKSTRRSSWWPGHVPSSTKSSVQSPPLCKQRAYNYEQASYCAGCTSQLASAAWSRFLPPWGSNLLYLTVGFCLHVVLDAILYSSYS